MTTPHFHEKDGRRFVLEVRSIVTETWSVANVPPEGDPVTNVLLADADAITLMERGRVVCVTDPAIGITEFRFGLAETTPAPKEVPQPASGDEDLANLALRLEKHAQTFLLSGRTDAIVGDLASAARALIRASTNVRQPGFSPAEINRGFAEIETKFAASGAPQEAPGDAPSDSQMLDWLEANKDDVFHNGNDSWTVCYGPHRSKTALSLRAAISAVMKGPQ